MMGNTHFSERELAHAITAALPDIKRALATEQGTRLECQITSSVAAQLRGEYAGDWDRLTWEHVLRKAVRIAKLTELRSAAAKRCQPKAAASGLTAKQVEDAIEGWLKS